MFKRSSLLREPIIHFLAAGGFLYILVILIRGPDTVPVADNVIVVDRPGLLSFLQYRSNAFDPEAFSKALDSMSEQELAEFIEAYIDEEVLYREAVSLNLDNSDYIIRQRMVQKMKFLLGDLSVTEEAVSKSDMQSFYEENKASYWVEPSATFTHVFFDSSRHGNDKALELARQTLEELNAQQAGFNDAVGHGDRFVFLRNYVERTLKFVEGHFGTDFAQNLSELNPSNSQWQGPLPSAYGYHLVLLTQFSAGRYPNLEEVRSLVERDYNTEKSERALAEITQSVRDRYQIEIRDLQSGN